MASDPTDQSAEQYADSALAFIESKLPSIDALSVLLNQRARTDGTPYDVMDVGWRMTPAFVNMFAESAPDADAVRQAAAVTSVTYYSHPDAAKNWQHIVLHEIVVKASKVLSIYAGLGAVHRLPDPAVLTTNIQASPNSIYAGDTVILRWDTSGAIEATIEPELGPVPLSGLTEVTPQTTTTYTLTAKGWTDTLEDRVLVTVGGA